MLSVLLADDERVILRGLTKLIDWEKFGLRLIGEVYKGDELLKAIIERSPNIIITDISMPGLSGIEVLKRIKELGIQTKVIFISAYREFSYAQDALSYGAVDYLIKPIDSEKLEQILLKTVADIREASIMEINNSRLHLYELKQKQQSVVDFLEKLTEDKKLSSLPEWVRELAGTDPDIRFSVIAVEADRSPNHTGSWVEEERKLLYFAIQNIMEELIHGNASGWALSNRAYFHMVLRHDKGLNMDELASQIHANIQRFLKFCFTVGLGVPGTLEQIPESYREANICVAYKFFLGVNRFISFSSIPPAPKSKGIDREKAEKELLKSMSSLQKESALGLLDDWLETVKSQSWGNKEYSVNLCNTMLVKALHEMSPSDIDTESEELRFMRQLHECETMDEMSRFIRLELELLRMKVLHNNSSKLTILIVQIKAYIDEHYQEEINLETMAARFFMNSYYFSSFFKKNTSQNFKQYVTEIRMKHALQMLMQTDAMLYEIAEKVGYNNARQFSDMFKKFYGSLPNDYKQQLLNPK